MPHRCRGGRHGHRLARGTEHPFHDLDCVSFTFP
jgi:hypothetical protein